MWGFSRLNINLGSPNKHRFAYDNITKRGFTALADTLAPKEENSDSDEKSVLLVDDELVSLIQKATDFKIRMGSNLQHSNDEYSHLQNEVAAFLYDFTLMESAGYHVSELSSNQVQQLMTVMEMINLNLDLREKECGPQLDVISDDLDADSGERGYTLIEKVLEEKELVLKALDEFVVSMSGNSRNGAISQRLASTVVANFRRYEESCQIFTPYNTPLSEIVVDELSVIRSQVSELYQSSGEKTETVSKVNGTLSEKLKVDEKFSKSKTQTDSKYDKKLNEMLTTLESAYSVEYADEETLDLGEYQIWRKRVRSTCDNIFHQLISSEIPDSSKKRDVEEMVREIDEELSRKMNSILFAVAADCSSARTPTEDSLELTAEFNVILQNDRENTMVRIKSVIFSLESLIETFVNLELASTKRQINIQRRLLERISKYLQHTKWTRLSQAEEIIEAEEEAYIVLEAAEAMAKNHEGIYV